MGARAAGLVCRVRRFALSTSVFGLFLFSTATPTPLYAVYATRWHFGAPALTAVFAVYAAALLATLLLFGDLSDAIGRRPVVLVATVLLIGGLALFALADGVGWLFAARLLQGLAVGLVTAAASAVMLDTEPPDHPRLAALANVLAAMGGQALGVLVSALLAELAPSPLRLVYLLSIGVAAVLAGLFLAGVPETAPARHRFTPQVRIGVPAAARAAFLAATPCLVATWAIGSFYLSLGPSLVSQLTGSANRVVAVSATLALLGAGTIAAAVARRRPARERMLGGCSLLGLGAVVTVVSLAVTTTPLFFAGTAVAGLGFGVAFAGALETLTALAPDDARGGLVSAVYVIAYLSFSIPAIVAGIVSTSAGLVDTAIGYSAVVAVLALTAALATWQITFTAAKEPDHCDPQAV
jgi:MFS family permease